MEPPMTAMLACEPNVLLAWLAKGCYAVYSALEQHCRSLEWPQSYSPSPMYFVQIRLSWSVTHCPSLDRLRGFHAHGYLDAHPVVHVRIIIKMDTCGLSRIH